jgi:hypothetical protein
MYITVITHNITTTYVWRLPADNSQLATLELYVEVEGWQAVNIQYTLPLPMFGGSQLTTASLPPWTSMMRLEGGKLEISTNLTYVWRLPAETASLPPWTSM